MFSRPNLPHISGLQEHFKGRQVERTCKFLLLFFMFVYRIVHTTQMSDLSFIQGKRVVVLGFGKSAVDCATVCAKYGASSVTHVFKRASWMMPRFVTGLYCCAIRSLNFAIHSLET
jgi:cation diffusion facilitator CzcD-associated flavoprotein CzcO